MIIIMNESRFNKHCAEIIAHYYGIASQNILVYPLHFFSKTEHPQKEPLFILDLDTDGHFQENKIPHLFAMELNMREVMNNVDDIYLLVSDVNVNKRLSVFANRFAKELTQLEDRRIRVHILTSLNYDMTFVVAPDSERKWQLYGIYEEDFLSNNLNLNLDTLHNFKNKNLVWEGEDILQCLNDPQNTYYGVSYAWSK